MIIDDDKAWTVAMLRGLADELEKKPARIVHVSRTADRGPLVRDARGRVVAHATRRVDDLHLTIDWQLESAAGEDRQG